MSAQRRALSNLGGETERAGAEEESRALAHALDVAPDEDVTRAHVHGFHVYPARMHPTTATRLVTLVMGDSPSNAHETNSGIQRPALQEGRDGGRVRRARGLGAEPPARQRAKVLDPFCGSGTVLACAMLLGWSAVGTDLNPLAVLLTSRKLVAVEAAHAERLAKAAASARDHADTRRKARAGAHKRYPAEDVDTYDPHVLLELDSLRHMITQTTDGVVRDDLRLVLSAILTKVSRRRGDTSEETTPKRIAAGFTAKLFSKKAEDLVARRAAFSALLGAPRPRAFVFQDDARELRHVRTGECAGAVTSPPYAGTYDYLAHHAARLRWLDLDARPLDERELGARRHRIDARGWELDLTRVLRAMHRALAPGARAALLLGDSDAGGVPLRADHVIARAAPVAGFRLVARASQPRPHFRTSTAFRAAPRREHALLLERDAVDVPV